MMTVADAAADFSLSIRALRQTSGKLMTIPMLVPRFSSGGPLDVAEAAPAH